MKNSTRRNSAIALGAGVGIILGAGLGNAGVGLVLGAALGVVCPMIFDRVR